MFGFGTIVFIQFQGLNPLAAFTASVSTITTIGIYAPNIVSMPPIEQVIMVVIFIVSVGLAASLVQSIVTTAVRREILREELVTKRVSRLGSHIIVAGDGRLREETTRWLDDLNVDHVVLTPNSDVVRTLIQHGKLAIRGESTNAHQALKLANVRTAKALVCAFQDDGDNMLVAMTARNANPMIKILMGVTDRTTAESVQLSENDVALPLLDLTAHVLAHSALTEEVVGVFLSREQKMKEYPLILERLINSDGVTPKEVEGIDHVIMVARGGELIRNPQPDFKLAKGDLVYIYSRKGSNRGEPLGPQAPGMIAANQ
jgi:Trk K+ transport system NAD-binding subunit